MNQKLENLNRHLKRHTVSGCALIAIGAWVALAPFVAGTWAWEWNFGRFLLTVVPGTAVALGGLAMLAGQKKFVSAGGGLALAGGIWLIAGPVLFAAIAGPELGTTPEGAAVRMLELFPFFFVAGALASFVSSYAAGFLEPLEFEDELGTEPSSTRRARVPTPPERSRRERGAKEPVRGRARSQSSSRRSPKSDS